MLLDNVATIVDGEVMYESEPLKMTDAEAEELMNLLPELYELWAADEDGL